MISVVTIFLIGSIGLTAAYLFINRQTASLKLDSATILDLKKDSYFTSLTDADSSLSNINSNGHNIYYDVNNSANAWIGGKTITLSGGGKLIPKKALF